MFSSFREYTRRVGEHVKWNVDVYTSGFDVKFNVENAVGGLIVVDRNRLLKAEGC